MKVHLEPQAPRPCSGLARRWWCWADLTEDSASAYEPWGSDDLAAAVREYAHLGLDIRKYGGGSVLRLEEVEPVLEARG